MSQLIRAIASPTILIQLVLAALLAGIIGLTSQTALQRAGTRITAATSTQLDALADLHAAELAINQADYTALSAVYEPDPHHRSLVEFPRILASVRDAQISFAQFQASAGGIQGQSAIEAQISGLLQTAATLSHTASRYNALSFPPAFSLLVFNATESAYVYPLLRDLSQLEAAERTAIAGYGQTGVADTQYSSNLLLVLIGLAGLVVAVFQIGSALRVHRLLQLAGQQGDQLLRLNRHAIIRSANPAVARLLGYPQTDLVGRHILGMLHPADVEHVRLALLLLFEKHQDPGELEYRIQGADGEYLWFTSRVLNLLGDPWIRRVIVQCRDITVRKQREQTLLYQSSYDPLTRLPNRALLLDRLGKAIRTAGDFGGKGALLVLDVDQFKEINENFGYAAGDALLTQIGARLSPSLRGDELVARLTADQFAVLLPGTDRQTVGQRLQILITLLDEPFSVAEERLVIGVTFGIALYPVSGTDPTLPLQQAIAALNQARRDHLGVALYDPAQDRRAQEHLVLLRELRQALQDNQLELYYQPKVNLSSSNLVGVEALLRWRHPTRGFIPPDQFIPLAEQSGLITALTDWVLETALQQCRLWKNAGWTVPVAVNLSARVLQEPGLSLRVSGLLSRLKIYPAELTLEITETGLMADPVHAQEVLADLHARGIRLSIDDFGMGYSSLGYLKELPVDELKIDKGFVLGTRTGDNHKNEAIVRAVIVMAHALQLKVVAEGVEDGATHAFLSELLCDTIQGYYIGRPVPPQEIERRLHETGLTFKPVSVAKYAVPQSRSLGDGGKQ